MTVESGHEPTEWESVPRPTTQSTQAAQTVQYNAARHGSHVEESPELLRWRADLLMDEMMMGGVDVSAADGNRTFSGVDAPVVQRPQAPANGSTGYSDNGRSPRNGYERSSHDDSSHTNGSQSGSQGGSQSSGYSNGHYHPTDTNGGGYQGEPTRNDLPTDAARYVEPPQSSRESYNHTDARERDGGHEGDQYDRDHQHNRERRADDGTTGRYAPDSSTTDPRSLGPSHPPRPEVGNNRGYDEPLRQPPTRPTPPTSPNSNTYDNGMANYGFDDDPNERRTSSPRPYSGQYSGPSSTQPLPREDEARQSRPVASEPSNEPSPYPSPLRTTMDGAPASSTSEQKARTDRLYSVEQQYEQFRREQSANIQPVEPPPPPLASRPPLPPVQPSTPPSTTPPRVTPQPVDEHTQWATGPDKWEYQDFSANPAVEEDSLFLNGYPAPDRGSGQDSAVRHDSSQFTSAMSVFSNSKKRSTLLPRMSTLDVDTLHREISDLHGEIAALLPVGNETGERARHLLDKAYSILQSDPMRSAEVEYYMQQVRTIVQRLHQARQWSDLYRQRLHVYLWGWLGLSLVLVIARFLFQTEIEEAFMWLLGVGADNVLVAHWATFVGTAFAGALGGAIGALYTMQTHVRGEYSFFDRKYGLRGLILPFMGLSVGALGYVIFGLVFALVGVDPSQGLTAAIVPTMAAFAFGFSQESIYGTRG